jgi:hypothetical protein
MKTNLNAKMTLPAMRATLLDDQISLNRQILDSMSVPKSKRAQLEQTLTQTARRLIAAMPDDDVKVCFVDEGDAGQ